MLNHFSQNICFVSGILAGLAGIFILLSGKRNPLNRSWFFFNLSIMTWLLGFGVAFTSDPTIAVYGERIMDGGTIFIPVSFLYFTSILTGRYQKQKLFILANLFIGIIFTAAMMFTNYFFHGLGKFVEEMNYYVFDYGWAYYVFLVWFAVLCVYCFYLLFSSSKSEKLDPAKRQQLKFVFWGVLVALVSGSINFMLDIVTIPFYYNLLVPFYLVFVGYAVIKNQLFGIKVIVTELLVAVMGFILLVFSFQMPDRWLSLAAAGIFIVYCFIGYLLIKTTMGEVNAKENLESKVRERTRDLQASNEALEQSKAVAEERAQELEKWYKLTIGREVRMAELKEKIKEMEDKKQ